MTDLKTFLAANVGRWLVQRTSFYLEAAQDEAGKLELTLDWLTEGAILPQLVGDQEALGVLTMHWSGTLVSGAYQGTSALALLPNGVARGWQNQKLLTGTYGFDQENLTIILTQGQYTSEERIWFGSKNLRMRALTIKREDGFSVVSFFSEIRALPPATP
jgi:CpeS-like protein